MSFILFASKEAETGRQLEHALDKLLSGKGKKVEVCRSIDAFVRRLRRPIWTPSLIVILMANRKELDDVLALRTLLLDRRIVLILPDSSDECLSEGLALRPRYFCDLNTDFEEVLAVLRRMIGIKGAEGYGKVCGSS